MAQFFYQGTPVSELPSVLQYKGMAQVREIDSRLQALYLHCAENGYIMTKAHIRAVLGISHDVYGGWIAGKLLPVREGRRGRRDQERNGYIRNRSACLKKWETLAQALLFAKISKDKPAARAIFPAKAVFGYSEQERPEERPAISIEVFLQEARRQRDKGGTNAE